MDNKVDNKGEMVFQTVKNVLEHCGISVCFELFNNRWNLAGFLIHPKQDYFREILIVEYLPKEDIVCLNSLLVSRPVKDEIVSDLKEILEAINGIIFFGSLSYCVEAKSVLLKRSFSVAGRKFGKHNFAKLFGYFIKEGHKFYPWLKYFIEDGLEKEKILWYIERVSEEMGIKPKASLPAAPTPV